MNAEKKNVGKVTPEQKDEIQALFERRNSLKELFMVVNPNNAELYERVIADMAETQKKFEAWWSDRAAEYGWEGAADARWEIDFNTCDIYLVCDKHCDCDGCR